jgi:hypothetical protein
MKNGRFFNNSLIIQLGLVTVVAVLIGGFAITPSYGQAQSNTIRVSTPFESSGVPLCGGEDIVFTGKINSVFHETITPDGDAVYTFSHTNFQGVTGVSESGEAFVVTDVFNQNAHTTQTGTNEFNTVIHGTLVDKGQGVNGENTLFQFVFHTVIHPDGEITGEVVHEETKCVGGSDQAFSMDLLGMIS